MHFLETSILKTVAYFDVFKYPLLKREIGYFLDQQFDEGIFNTTLQSLIDNKVLYKLDNFYSLHNDISLVKRRIEGNNVAINELKKAKKASAFLYRWFPFMKGIGISGSLSKNFATENSDYDFFIITSKNRLWISRTIFIIFFKIACIFGFRKMFCLNYIIDETALEIPEQNIFTATEIATLLVCDGKNVYEEFFNANKWTEDVMPNYSARLSELNFTKPSLFKKLLERFLKGKAIDKLNKRILHFYERRWKKLFAKNILTPKGSKEGGMIITANVCKPMPQYFQQSILDCFNEKFKAAKNVMAEKLYFDTENSLKKPA
jgi:hypothetical protein